jgi:Rha family phage regulatory protein
VTQTHELVSPEMRTTSRVVAEKFGKRHADVLRGIENATKDLPEGFTERNFALSSYLDSTGRALPQYQLTRDGFTLITMGFTGRAAMEWKIRFIEAFNAMEAELRAGSEPPELEADAELGPRDWLAMIREARLLGGISAGRRIWAMSPLPPLTAPHMQIAAIDPAEGRACLAHVLAHEASPGVTVADLIADVAAGALDSARALAELGLRRHEAGLFVAQSRIAGLEALFAGTGWTGGRHRAALLAVPGARLDQRTLLGTQARGVTVPLGGDADV